MLEQMRMRSCQRGKVDPGHARGSCKAPYARSKHIVRCTVSDGQLPDRNPFELLRETRDPRLRAALMLELDGKHIQFAEAYRPSDTEALLSKELGIWKQTVMQLAVSKPDLAALDALTQVKPAIKALKDANIAPEDIWFLVTKRHSMLGHPTILQRWLDFLSVYGLTPQNVQNFLLRASDDMLINTTLFQAGQVVGFLKSLGIKDDFLAARVLAVWPQVLAQDVESQLRPVVMFLMQYGIEAYHIRGVVCAWPELLLCNVDTQLQPWARFLKEHMGCTSVHVATIIQTCPHLLGFPAEDVFRSHLQGLQNIGITTDDMRRMCEASIGWLTNPGGITQQLDFLLKQAGFTPEQARQLVVSAPQLLTDKEFELQRKWQWLQDVCGADKASVVACPQAMGLNQMRVLGPRHGFMDEEGKLDQLKGDMLGNAVRIDLAKLCLPTDDVEWCMTRGISPLDYAKYRAHWEEDYTQGLVRSAAEEFQEELKKLGIYEGE